MCIRDRRNNVKFLPTTNFVFRVTNIILIIREIDLRATMWHIFATINSVTGFFFVISCQVLVNDFASQIRYGESKARDIGGDVPTHWHRWEAAWAILHNTTTSNF